MAVATLAEAGRAEFAAVPARADGVTLPKTATDAELRLWFGLAALLREPDPDRVIRRRRCGMSAQCLPR